MLKEERISIISLGAGVQSSALLLMACHGELNTKPVAAIFADTGWEPEYVYDHLEYLKSVSSIPIIVTSYSPKDAEHGVSHAIQDRALRNPIGVDMPMFLTNNETGKKGMLRRQCTHRYKLLPIRKAARKVMLEHGVKKMDTLLGISLDEIGRMKPSDVQYATNVYPLIDKRMTRHDCQTWLAQHGYNDPPKSACKGCPYHSKQAWIDLKQQSPQDFDDACSFDDAMRNARPGYQAFLHSSRIPLRQVDFSTAKDEVSFLAECEGMCGV